MTLTAFAQQPLAAPQAITDPTKLESKNVADMQTFSIEKLYMTRQIGDSTWSPDGKQVAFISNISGRNNLWLVPAAGGWPTQLTISDQRQAQPVWSPDGTWIAYTSDHDGDEQWDIFLVSPKTGDVVNLTMSPESAEDEPAWSPDGRADRLRHQAQDRLQLRDRADGRRHAPHPPPDQEHAERTEQRGAHLFARWQVHSSIRNRTPDGKDAKSFCSILASGKSTNLTPHEGQHNYRAADISPDGKTVLITSDAHNGYDNVGLLDIATRKIDWLTDEKWELNAGTFSPDGKSLTWTANIDGNTNIYLLRHR